MMASGRPGGCARGVLVALAAEGAVFAVVAAWRRWGIGDALAVLFWIVFLGAIGWFWWVDRQADAADTVEAASGSDLCRHCGEPIWDDGDDVWCHEWGDAACDSDAWDGAVDEQAEDDETGETYSKSAGDYYEGTYAEPCDGATVTPSSRAGL